MAGKHFGEIAFCLLLLTTSLGCTSAPTPGAAEPRVSATNTVTTPTLTTPDIKPATLASTLQSTFLATSTSKVNLPTTTRFITRALSTPTLNAVIRRSLEPDLLKVKLFNTVEVQIAAGVVISDPLGHRTKIFSLPTDATVSFFGGISSATWSRDGKRILISHTTHTFMSALKIINDDGANLRDITPASTGYISYAIWSPDGKRIVFHSETQGQGCIFVMSSEGGQAQKVNRCEFQDEPLYWSDDGKYVIVYFAGQKNGPGASLNVLDVDGDQRSPISQASGQYYDESYHPWRLINRQNCNGTTRLGVFNWNNFRVCQ